MARVIRLLGVAAVIVLTAASLSWASPALTYSSYYGDANQNSLGPIAVDAAGNMYVLGLNRGVTKLSADGKTALYSVVLGDWQPRALTVDAAGNAYVAFTCAYPRSGITPNCPFASSGRPQSQG